MNTATIPYTDVKKTIDKSPKSEINISATTAKMVNHIGLVFGLDKTRGYYDKGKTI